MGTVTVKLHGAFSEFAGGSRTTRVEATDVAGALAAVAVSYPNLAERLRDEHGRLRDHVIIFANDEDVRYLDGARTALGDGDIVHIVPAVSGGEA